MMRPPGPLVPFAARHPVAQVATVLEREPSSDTGQADRHGDVAAAVKVRWSPAPLTAGAFSGGVPPRNTALRLPSCHRANPCLARREAIFLSPMSSTRCSSPRQRALQLIQPRVEVGPAASLDGERAHQFRLAIAKLIFGALFSVESILYVSQFFFELTCSFGGEVAGSNAIFNAGRGCLRPLPLLRRDSQLNLRVGQVALEG